MWNATTGQVGGAGAAGNGLPPRTAKEVLAVLQRFNTTVQAHLDGLGWLPSSKLKPNDWSARLCCDATTEPHPCFCDNLTRHEDTVRSPLY